MKRVAVLTSGGDAPGMNAAIRAVVRMAISKGWETFGVQHGYAGLINNEIIPLGPRDVGGIIQLGGTMLGSARSPEFKTEAGQRRALNLLSERGIDGVFVIGGNGSQTGANALHNLGIPVVGIASTIDNDLYGSDITIGVDTALNIALEAIDRLKVTASSHSRAFLIEVMGRNCGYIALMTGIAGGAEAIVIPEVETSPEEIVEELQSSYQRGKSHSIVVVAEGAKNNAAALMEFFKAHDDIGFEIRATTLGHVQRGGTPGVFDRLLATRLGAHAVEVMARGESGVLVGQIGNKMATTPLVEIAGKNRPVDGDLLQLAKILAR